MIYCNLFSESQSNLSEPKRSSYQMNIPVLSRTTSLQSARQQQKNRWNKSQDKDSTLASSLNNHSSQPTQSSTSFHRGRVVVNPEQTPSPRIFQQYPQHGKHSCARHGRKFAYTCATCLDHVCSECLHDPTQHRNHRFQRYNQKKEDMKLTKRQLSQLKNGRIDQISRLISIKQEQRVTKIENGKTNEQMLQSYCRRIADTYDSLNQLERQCKDYSTILKQFNQYYDLSLAELKNTTQVALISGTGTDIADSYQLKIKQVSETVITRCESYKGNLIKPQPYSRVFKVNQFSKARKQGKEIIFQSFEVFQSFWKLKVYPSGFSGVKADEKHAGIQYMSVYAERVSGTLDIATFIIRIQTVSRINPELKIKKQFQSEFTRNQSWGYDRFTRLSNIYQHGFLGQDDKLIIKLSICPINFYQATQALTTTITQKERIKQENERKIKIMKVQVQKKMEARAMNRKLSLDLEVSRVLGEQKSMVQVGEKVRQGNEVFKSHLSARVIAQIKEKLFQEVGSLGISRIRPIISHKKSPPKLIRLVSLKNMQLIQHSMKKIHCRSSTVY